MILYTSIKIDSWKVLGIPIYISCQKALLQEWGSHNNMYKTFLNRTKDILKCVKDKTNSMHFS